MSDVYWEIVEFDGAVTQIPPQAVETVKRRWDNKQPIHVTGETNVSIAANQIKSFRPTDKVYGSQPLLEAAAAAFNEPMYNDDGSVIIRWIKRRVPSQLYHRRYAGIPAYRYLGDEGGMVVMAYRLPVHLVDTSVVDYATDDEVERLTKS